ncbi:uncharacterized protein LOC109791099 [Cajanus cajan]|uniref:uncharacterized protein LOC109791099 n=1 Tax=Cajanus cajan TaxID=3821 RepID=UPI00098D92F5|nr:uncharacterized protein LOC109791099 [Cajanus cajan]
MGNIHSSNNFSQRFPLDDNSVAVIRKTKSRKGREVVDTWTAEYYSFGKTSCELELTKTNQQELFISLLDHAPSHANDHVDFRINMSVEEGLLLANVTLNGPRTCMHQLPERKTPIAQGGVLKSSSILYGRDSDRKGLIVILRAKRNDDDKERPYMITLKHYFVAASSSHGVCVVAKIRSDGGLSVEIEKPSTQPKRDMLHMFDDVKGKGWCPNPSSSDCAIELFNQNNGKVRVIRFEGMNNPAANNGLPYLD